MFLYLFFLSSNFLVKICFVLLIIFSVLLTYSETDAGSAGTSLLSIGFHLVASPPSAISPPSNDASSPSVGSSSLKSKSSPPIPPPRRCHHHHQVHRHLHRHLHWQNHLWGHIKITI
jgi:hypothetical protein